MRHPPIEAGQLGAATVQRHHQIQRITDRRAEGRILEQSLELVSGMLAGMGSETVMASLDPQVAIAVGLGDQPVAADPGFAVSRYLIPGSPTRRSDA